MKKTHIGIHHSASPDHPTFLNMEAVRKYHTGNNGWRDIGYSHVVERIGNFYEVLLGRIPNDTLAHAPELGMNTKAFGVCFLGDFDLAPPPDELWMFARPFILDLAQDSDIPIENVLGHREIQILGGVPVKERKSCPGKFWDMEKFRAYLRNPLPELLPNFKGV